MTIRYIIPLIILVILGCNTGKNAGTPKLAKCDMIGTVKDFTGLDACTFMIIDDKGKKLLPADGAKGFEFQDGQKITFSYEKMPDMMSACMAEDLIVKLTCIEVLGVTPSKKECVKVSMPYENEWLKGLNEKYRPYQINRYNYLDGYAYFLSTRDMNYLYDCQGDLICQYEAQEKGACATRVDGLEDEVVIWIID